MFAVSWTPGIHLFPAWLTAVCSLTTTTQLTIFVISFMAHILEWVSFRIIQLFGNAPCLIGEHLPNYNLMMYFCLQRVYQEVSCAIDKKSLRFMLPLEYIAILFVYLYNHKCVTYKQCKYFTIFLLEWFNYQKNL